jgi:hypothetical protein
MNQGCPGRPRQPECLKSGCGCIDTSRYRQGRVHCSCRDFRELTSVCWHTLASSERDMTSKMHSLVQRDRWCCERQTCEETENRITCFIRCHSRTLAEAGVARGTDSSRRCASSARARLRRWRSASGLMPHTTAASAGRRPSTPTSSRTSRNAVGRVASATSIRRSSSLLAVCSNGEAMRPVGHSPTASTARDSSMARDRQ